MESDETTTFKSFGGKLVFLTLKSELINVKSLAVNIYEPLFYTGNDYIG